MGSADGVGAYATTAASEPGWGERRFIVATRNVCRSPFAIVRFPDDAQPGHGQASGVVRDSE